MESLFAEARKLSVSVVSANQYLDQYPGSMRSAVLAIGTQIFFQLSSTDADRIAPALGGGRQLRSDLRDLPKRELILKTGSEAYARVRVPEVPFPRINPAGLLARSNAKWTRTRRSVEDQIRERQQLGGKAGQDAWE